MRLPAIPLLLALLLLATGPTAKAGALKISSPDFKDGASIPARFTADGENVPPALQIAGVPAGAKSLALIVDDPDAPSGTFTHWLVWNIPPDTRAVAARTAGVQGTNSFGNAGYSGPKPPSGTHRYFFKLSALDITLQLAPGASRKELEAAIQGHIVGSAVLMGRYSHGGSP